MDRHSRSYLVTSLILNNLEPIFLLMEVDAEVTRIATEYLEAASWGVPALVFYTAFRHSCEGLGRTIPPMLIAASIIPLNALLNYGFIYGHFGLPELGGAGCGRATAIVWWVQPALMLIVINRPFFKEQLSFPHRGNQNQKQSNDYFW